MLECLGVICFGNVCVCGLAADVKLLAQAMGGGKTRNVWAKQIKIFSGSLPCYGHLEYGPELAQNVNDPRSQMSECHKGPWAVLCILRLFPPSGRKPNKSRHNSEVFIINDENRKVVTVLFFYSAKNNRRIPISSGNIFVHLSFLSPYGTVGIMKIPLNF